MRRIKFRLLPALALVSVALNGCAKDREAQQAAPDNIVTSANIPLAIKGQATILRFSFPHSDQRIEPGAFNADEICYLDAGDFRIDCYPDGSSLNLGPTDSNDLLTDNPMSGLAPARDDKDVAQTMKLYGVLFLVGGSLDRLPGALGDYIQDPGPHLTEALDLVRLLLKEKRVEFQGHARGGNFTVSVELTSDGSDKLMDALDEIGQTTSPIQLVSFTSGGRTRPSAQLSR
jgi:hypothetical protein